MPLPLAPTTATEASFEIISAPVARRRRVWLWGVGAVVALLLALLGGFVAGGVFGAGRGFAAGAATVPGGAIRAPQRSPVSGTGWSIAGMGSWSVTSVHGQIITARAPSGKTVTIHVSSSTSYTQDGKQVSLSAIKPGEIIAIVGQRNSDGSFNAQKIVIQTQGASGTVPGGAATPPSAGG